MLKSELKQIIRFTSVTWRGKFTEEELKENLEEMWHSYKKCRDAKFSEHDDINILANLMLQDLNDGNYEDIVFTLEQFEETVKRYIEFINLRKGVM